VMKKFDRAKRWPVNKASRCVNPPGMLDVSRRNVPTKLGKMLVILHVPISE
jgi:hypothetical protein